LFNPLTVIVGMLGVSLLMRREHEHV